ncbi:MAG: MATE family efflux transporter [Paludibacteraceae bacterium]|nr:MATE family efflux transporter [Paludibacteraceae bacterium]
MSVNREILRLSVPSILANITIPLVGLVDMTIAGHIADAAAIGGIAIGSVLFNILYWNFSFLRVGTSGVTAQAFGRQDWDECNGQLKHAMKIALWGALGVLLIQWVFITVALKLVPCSYEVAEQARKYFFIRVWAAPATLSLFALKGWFIGVQDTTSPMITDLIVNTVNMFASYFLAVHTPLGILGVAYGTVIAQFSGLITAFILLIVRYQSSFVQLFKPFIKPIVATAKMNRDLFYRSLCFMIVYTGYTVLSSKYGDEELAISSLIMNIFMLVSFFIDGFAYAGEAMVGRHFGQCQVGVGKASDCYLLVLYLHSWCFGVAVLFALVFGWGGQELMTWLWPDVARAAADWNYLPWLIAMPLLSAMAFMWDGIYVGATATKEIRNAMIGSAVAFVVVYILCMNRMGIEAVLYAYFAHLIERDIYLTISWKRTYDRQIKTQTLESNQE